MLRTLASSHPPPRRASLGPTLKTLSCSRMRAPARSDPPDRSSMAMRGAPIGWRAADMPPKRRSAAQKSKTNVGNQHAKKQKGTENLNELDETPPAEPMATEPPTDTPAQPAALQACALFTSRLIAMRLLCDAMRLPCDASRL